MSSWRHSLNLTIKPIVGPSEDLKKFYANDINYDLISPHGATDYDIDIAKDEYGDTVMTVCISHKYLEPVVFMKNLGDMFPSIIFSVNGYVYSRDDQLIHYFVSIIYGNEYHEIYNAGTWWEYPCNEEQELIQEHRVYQWDVSTEKPTV